MAASSVGPHIACQCARKASAVAWLAADPRRIIPGDFVCFPMLRPACVAAAAACSQRWRAAKRRRAIRTLCSIALTLRLAALRLSPRSIFSVPRRDPLRALCGGRPPPVQRPGGSPARATAMSTPLEVGGLGFLASSHSSLPTVAAKSRSGPRLTARIGTSVELCDLWPEMRVQQDALMRCAFGLCSLRGPRSPGLPRAGPRRMGGYVGRKPPSGSASLRRSDASASKILPVRCGEVRFFLDECAMGIRSELKSPMITRL